MKMLSKWAFRFLITGVFLDLIISIVLAITLVNQSHITTVANCWDSILRYAVTHPMTHLSPAQLQTRAHNLTVQANHCAALRKGN